MARPYLGSHSYERGKLKAAIPQTAALPLEKGFRRNSTAARIEGLTAQLR
jgi:hypothetical protein